MTGADRKACHERGDRPSRPGAGGHHDPRGQAQRPERRHQRRHRRRHERARGRPRALVRDPHRRQPGLLRRGGPGCRPGRADRAGRPGRPDRTAPDQAADRRRRGVRPGRRPGAGALLRPGGGLDDRHLRAAGAEAGADARLRRRLPDRPGPARQRRP